MAYQDPQKLEKLLSAYLDGTIDETQEQELFSILDHNEDARDMYAEHMVFHATMLHKAGGRGTVPSLEPSVESADVLLPPLEVEDSSSSVDGWSNVIQKGLGGLPGFVSIVGVVSALSVIGTLLVVATISWQSGNEPAPQRLAIVEGVPSKILPKPNEAPTLLRQIPATVAQITRVVDAKWSERSWRPLGLDYLSVGRRLELESGLAEIKYNTGACVILRGPAIFNVTAENAGLLNAGQLTANVPETAIGFTIETPQGNVVDFGTEFGIEVDETSAVGVHVFQGEVEVELADKQEGDDGKISLFEKQALSVDTSTSQVKRFASTPEYFVRAITDDLYEGANTKQFTHDDFEQDTHARYAGSNSYGGGGSFAIKHDEDGNGVLEITTGENNTYSVVSKQPLLGVGESFSMKVPGKIPRQGVFLVISTVAAEPNGGMGGSFGLRFRRDERGMLVHHYDATRASNLMKETLTADPDQSAPLELSIERVSRTEFKFYYNTGSGPVPLTAEPIVNEDLGACSRLHVGVEAWGKKGDSFQFDNLKIKSTGSHKTELVQ